MPELVKAILTPEGGDDIEVLFNPTQYSLDKANQLAEAGVPGLNSPLVQFVRGMSRTLSMELFFDTYEKTGAQRDVRRHTDRVYALLAINRDTHVPPICTFTWGTFNFRCVVERVNGRFTMFLADGTPVRATLTVTFREFLEAELQARTTPTESTDRTKTWTVKRGETLSAIAAVEYGDPGKWRPIAEANGIDNPRAIEPGQVLVLPALTGSRG